MDETMYECLMCKYESPWLFAFQFHHRNRHSCPSDAFQYFECFQELKETKVKTVHEEINEYKYDIFDRKCDTSENHCEKIKCKGKKQNKHVLKCTYCNSFETVNKERLSRHILKKHEISEKWVDWSSDWRLCDYCPRKFKEKKSLREHLRRSHFTSEVHLACTKCPYKAESLKDLKSHQECTGHGNGEAEKIHQCSKCLYGTDYKGDFEKHILRRHTKVQDVRRWFECTNCPYMAKENKYLTQHILNVHTKESEVKWFECAQCGHKSKNKAHLRGHIMNMHSDSKPKFKCSYCDFESFHKNCVIKHKVRKHH